MQDCEGLCHVLICVQVEKLTNQLLFRQYQLKKADMEQKFRGDVERTLYHGTNESSVKEICIHGFNRSFCGKNGNTPIHLRVFILSG